MPTKKKISDDKLKAAMMSARKMYGHRPDVTACDVGYKWEGDQPTQELCVRIHVQRKIPLSELEASQVFPTEINDVPLDVIQGPYKIHRATSANEHKIRSPFLMGGLSCGRETGGTGTIAAIVVDNVSGRPAVLSNWHVLHGPFGLAGDPILQPGRADGGNPVVDAIAQLGRSILDVDGDAAIAPLVGGRPWLPLVFGSYALPSKIRETRLGELLTKSGRTTAQSVARVDGEGFYKLAYEISPGQREVREIRGFKLVPVEPGNPDDLELSSGGDSGSLWTNPNSGDAVGLHFAGEVNDDPSAEFAIACNLSSVFRRLDVRLATFDDLLGTSTQTVSADHIAVENRIGLTPLPPGIFPPVPMPAIGPNPPIGPYPGWPPMPPICSRCGLSDDIGARSTTGLPAPNFGITEGLAAQRTQISLTAYIWPMLKRALIAKNPAFAPVKMFSTFADYLFTASGGTIEPIISDAVNRSSEFQADGLTVTGRYLEPAQDFFRVCWLIGQRYPGDRFEIVD